MCSACELRVGAEACRTPLETLPHLRHTGRSQETTAREVQQHVGAPDCVYSALLALVFASYMHVQRQ